MTIPAWSPAGFYPPGALVVPRNPTAGSDPAIPNASFETGDATGWDLISSGGSTTTVVNEPGYDGAYCVKHVGTGEFADGAVIGQTKYAVIPGQQFQARCYGKLTTGGPGASFSANVYWFDASNNPLPGASGYTAGPQVSKGSGAAAWRPAAVSVTVPAGAAFASIAGIINTSTGPTTTGYIDTFSWSYVSPAPVGLMYKAVQAVAGFSAATEPTWPLTLGVTVVDNEVTWEAVAITRVTWEARPLLRSGGSEPDWPGVLGGTVVDGTITWTAISSRVEDPKCPNSKIVIILASKVYAANGDITAYSATTNPLDWSTMRDAGYLPTNLQQYGANPVAALGAYRSNLLVFNSQGMQMWQVDEDPELSNLLDALPIPCVDHWTYAPVSNDGLFYSPLGVRSMNISAGSTNLAAGDVGLPVDPVLTQSYRDAQTAGVRPLGFYFPGSGQYWLSFNVPGELEVDVEPAEDGDPVFETYEYSCIAWIYTITAAGAVGSWSRYLFPFSIDAVTQDGTTLVFRSGDNVIEYDTTALNDFDEGEDQQPFPGVVWWPYLDMNAPGVEKNLIGFDSVGTGKCVISFGFAQDDPADPLGYTTPYGVMADTIPGDVVPFEMTAPSFSVKITYNSGLFVNGDPSYYLQPESWKFLAMNLYLQSWRS